MNRTLQRLIDAIELYEGAELAYATVQPTGIARYRVNVPDGGRARDLLVRELEKHAAHLPITVVLKGPKGSHLERVTVDALDDLDDPPGHEGPADADDTLGPGALAGADSYTVDSAFSLAREMMSAAQARQKQMDAERTLRDESYRVREEAIVNGYIVLQEQHMRFQEQLFRHIGSLEDALAQGRLDNREDMSEMRGWAQVALETRVEAIEREAQLLEDQRNSEGGGDAIDRAVDRAADLVERVVEAESIVPPHVRDELVKDADLRSLLSHPKLARALKKHRTTLQTLLDQEPDDDGQQA